jgi:glycosyltransferase involved in cell wall biosynthesis
VPEKRRFLGLKLPHLWYKNGFKVSVFPNQEIKAALSSFKPDVVHVQVSDPIGLSVVSYAKKNNIPVVTTEHNQPEVLTDPLHMPRIMKRPTNYLLSAYFRNRQSKSDFVTMPTEQAIRGLLKGNKDLGVPIAAVSNGVDLSRFKPGKTSDVIYKKYSIPTDKLTVLYVGRVDPEKKVGTVIEAFLKAEVDNSQMVIVGDGVDKAKLENKFGKLDDIHFLGRVAGDDLYELYKIGDVFATASEIETQGIVLIEAAACGLPVIAVDKGAVSEVCLDEENGYLCEPGSVPEIAAAIKKILSDEKLRERFAKKSLEIAKEHDFETTLDKFINIYNKVTER